MDSLTDAKAVELARLVRLYFDDCAAEDPRMDGPGRMTVAELLEDLETSTDGETSERIAEHVAAIAELRLT